jgi:hypothetical protein
MGVGACLQAKLSKGRSSLLAAAEPSEESDWGPVPSVEAPATASFPWLQRCISNAFQELAAVAAVATASAPDPARLSQQPPTRRQAAEPRTVYTAEYLEQQVRRRLQRS